MRETVSKFDALFFASRRELRELEKVGYILRGGEERSGEEVMSLVSWQQNVFICLSSDF